MKYSAGFYVVPKKLFQYVLTPNYSKQKMTKPQIWVASFLFLFIVLFLLNRLTKEDEEKKVNKVENPVPQTDMTSEEISGAELVKRLGCTSAERN
jgi:hypothetical protein